MADVGPSFKPNPNFRPNPARAVYVQGVIDQKLIDRLTPRIVILQSQSRDPITVYIDSRGGLTASAEVLRRLLSASNQDFAAPCWLITVVTSRAASAAADLLSSGNYAVAYADSVIVYHGVRTSLEDPLTVEAASVLTEALKLSNDRYAMALATKSNWRFVFRYVSLRTDFDEYRQRTQQPSLTDLQCFVGLTSEKLSKTAVSVLDQARKRHARYEALVERVLKSAKRSKRFTNPRRFAEFESVVLRGVIDFELSTNKDGGWTFQERGMAQVNDDFLLLREYFAIYESQQLKDMCNRWAAFFLTKEDSEELKTIPEAERDNKRLQKVAPLIRPVWLFFVALCHALQEGENELTATDALWLGLIDEVIGVEGLPTIRFLAEFESPTSVPSPPEPPQIAATSA